MTAEIDVRSDGARVVVSVTGEIDIATAPDLDLAVERLESGDIVLDLRGVTFMGSVGLASMLRAHRHAGDLGGTLTVRVSTPVRDLLEMTRLLDRFTVE